jgi:hypothetical protein
LFKTLFKEINEVMAKDIKAISVKIRKYILEGLSPLKAAKVAGISDKTYYRWKEEDPKFVENIENAESEAELHLVKKIKSIALGTKNANALIALGDRRYGWTPKTATELQGKDGAPITFKIDAAGGFINPNNVLTTSTYNNKEEKSTEPS